MKAYDERYFKRWYHSSGSRIVSAAERTRRVTMVVSVAEFAIGRALRSVLDVGCGEARWQPIIRSLRKRATYTGVDSSEYAVRRFGRRRGIFRGTFSELDGIAPKHAVDLVVASDIIHYLGKSELEQGLNALVSRVGGVAYLDFLTSRDEVEGDMREMKLRSPEYYLRLFASHGLRPIGMQFYAGDAAIENLTAMEMLLPKHSIRSIP